MKTSARVTPLYCFTATRTLLIVLGSMAVQGTPIEWVANHRKHHAYADRPGDPHSPLEGFFHAHIGWLWIGEQADPRRYARDLLADPTIVLLNRLTPLWVVALTLADPCISSCAAS